MKHRSCPSVLLVAALVAGCAAERTSVPGLSFAAPSAWINEAPESPARVAEYGLPGDGASDDARLVVYYFGVAGAGTVQANLDRWFGQFEQPDGRDSADVAEIATRQINGLDVTTVDLEGTFVAETFPGSGAYVNKPGSRMLAAIVTTDSGPYYVKLVGPRSTVAHWERGFEQFLDGMRPAEAEGEAAASHP